MPGYFTELRYRAMLGIKKRIIMAPQPRPSIYIGAGSALQLCDTMAQLDLKHVLVVTDKPLLDLGLIDALRDRLESHGVQITVFDGVKPDPSVSVVRAGQALLKSAGCDSVLAIGGGSSMDSAKVIALGAANDLDVEQCVGLKKGKLPALPLYAIPTTAGTGSEVTFAAIISDDETHQKLAVADPKIVPLAAALDPELMTGLPPHITAATGMDALTHAIESYINIWDTPECLQYGKAATKLILNNLQTACQQGDDIAAREAMALASYYAGLAFTTCLVGYVHAVSHQLGGHYGVPHGLGNAIVLPHVLERFQDDATTRLAELAVHCELGDASESESVLARKLIDRIWALNEAIGIPRTTDLIQDKDIDAIVDAALTEGSGYPVPRFFERDECLALVKGLQA